MGRWSVVAGLAVLSVLTNCAGSRPEVRAALPDCPGPEWTCFSSGPCPFPEYSGMLCAVGKASKIESLSLGTQAANTQARREMAQVIEAKIDGFTRITQDSLSKTGAGTDEVQKVQDLAQSITERTLNGVAVPRNYNDGKGNHFAIAVLDSKGFVEALKGLKEAKGLSDATKLEIDRRADAVVGEWQRELDRKKKSP